jgi:predicted metalloprotease with PDZ domain
MSRLLFALAALLLSFSAHAARYDLTWRLSFDPKTKSALGSLELGKGRDQLRTLDFEFPEAYSDIRADGTLERKGKRALWTPPAEGGTLRWRVRIDETRDNGAYRSYFPGDWAIFRGDRVFPKARVRALKGAQSRARLILDVPKSWHLDTPYLTEADGSTFIVDDPDRGFDRPVGWMLVGDIGTRREVIAGTEVSLAAPKDEGMRRMDMLAFLNFTLPAMKQAFGELPPKILIASAPDPMWRGGLSAPQSLYLHLDRPMISENATSTLLHELTHVITRIRGERDDDDWLAEGLAEYYAVELLYRTGGMTEARHQRTLDWLADWGKNVKSLRAERSSAQTTARAALLLVEVDREIQKATQGKKNLDDVTRKLMRERKVSTAEFIEISEKVAGRKLKALDTALLR